jgi:hypothetical protein
LAAESVPVVVLSVDSTRYFVTSVPLLITSADIGVDDVAIEAEAIYKLLVPLY